MLCQRDNCLKELVFGVTEDDIGTLEEEEFKEVWAALGTVARARARAKKSAIEQYCKLNNTLVES